MILRPRQREFVTRCVGALKTHGNTLGVAPTGCHAPGTSILMYDGSLKPVEHIEVDELLMGPDGTPRRVITLHQGSDELFEIRPLKGQSFVINSGHVLTLARTNEGDLKRGRNRTGEVVDIALIDYLNASANYRHLHKLMRVAIDFPERPLPPIDPYFLGVLLGDGGMKHGVSITTPDAEIAEIIFAQAPQLGVRVRVEQIPGNQANSYHLVHALGATNPLITVLRELGLYGRGAHEKFIPQACLLGSRETRFAILAGLLDSDGHLTHRTVFEFCSASSRMASEVEFMARSLGYLATRKQKHVLGKLYWRVHICGATELIPTRVLHKQAVARKQKKDVLRTGFTVHPIGRGNYFGFTIDLDHRYLLGDFTVTHNSGKTICLSGTAGEFLAHPDAKACVLAHRDELTAQNQSKFSRVNPGISTSVFDARQKSWAGQATFAMVQTLARNLDQVPMLDLLVIDEAHHSAAPTYRQVIDTTLARNPHALIYGVTATPNRGDGKGLRDVFSNVADQIRLGELIRSGHLVSPRTFVIDVGTREALGGVRRLAEDYDMNAVATIMNTSPVNAAVVRHWQARALGRKTIAFGATVAHAQAVCHAFLAEGISAAVVHGELSEAQRKATLAEFETGDLTVIVNVAVLTEGYDYTPTACIILLRPSSYKSTLIQMIGRGLRVVDPAEHPGVIKTDCVVLDFGTASLVHGSLEQEVDLDGFERNGEPPTKECTSCGAIIPLASRECPICGKAVTSEDVDTHKRPLEDFVMSEIDLLRRSNFVWVDLFGDDCALLASGFTAWAGVFFLDGRWYALGGQGKNPVRLLGVGERTVCLAQANDWLNEVESDDSAHKTRRWLTEVPTEGQLKYLPAETRADFGLTRYQASALLTFRFNKHAIQRVVQAANQTYLEAA